MSAIVNPGTGGGGGGGSMNILEDGSTVVASATALNFVEPNLVLVTNAGGGQADVAMTSYLPYIGRPGVISALLSTDDDVTLHASGGTQKTLFIQSSPSVSAPELKIQTNFLGQESISIGPGLALGGIGSPPTLLSALQFLITNDCNINPFGAQFAAFSLNNGLDTSTTLIGISGNGTFSAITPSGPFDNFMKFIGTGVDSDGNIVFNPSPAALVFFGDGDPHSGYIPGQMAHITTSQSGVSANRLWIRHTGDCGIGDDVGYPEGRVHIRNVDSAVPAHVVQGTATQTADLSTWEGRVDGTLTAFPTIGATSIFLVDSTGFAASGSIYLWEFPFNAYRSVGYTANNTGTGEITLTVPLAFTVNQSGVYQSVPLMNIDAAGILSVVKINNPSVAVASPVASMIVFDTNINKHVGYDGTSWNPMY